ncbi:MAG: S41 family peptidase [Pyrinomonadaceae bacterium]
MSLNFSVLRNSLAASLVFAAAFFYADSLAVKAQTSNRSTAATADFSSAKERVEVFDEVWNTINEKYYDPKFNGVDWNAMREKYRPQALAATTNAEFYDVLTLMVGELRDAYTRVRSPQRRQESKNKQATNAGARLYEVEGVPVIYSVAPDSEAARAGVAPGMIVRTVDGLPVDDALAKARREVGTSSSERVTRLLAYSKLVAGEPDTQLKLGLTRPDKTPFDVTLTRRTVSAPAQFVANLLPSGYAYIKFDHFQSPVDKQIKDALIKYKDAPALILDLRANGGGDGELGLKIAGYFFDEKTTFASIKTRTGKMPSAFFGLFKLPKEFQAGKKGGQLYAHPVVVLINEATGSASELFADAMQEQNRAQIIGTQSCGCVLGILNFKKLKDGGDLAVSEIAFVTAKGRTLEGNGVMPDKPVALTLADLQSGRDRALKAAESYFNDLLKTKK